MILDAGLLFTGLAAASGIGNTDNTDSPTTGTQNSSNVIDLGVVNGLPASAVNGGGARDIGIGDSPSLKLLVNVNVAFGAGTSLQVALQGAPDAGNNTPGSYTTMWTGPAVVEANLIAGAQLANVDVPLVIPGQVLPRYLRLNYITVGTHTSGKIEAGIVLDRSDQIKGIGGALSGYQAGINVAN